jgi:hypothetical protein
VRKTGFTTETQKDLIHHRGTEDTEKNPEKREKNYSED